MPEEGLNPEDSTVEEQSSQVEEVPSVDDADNSTAEEANVEDNKETEGQSEETATEEVASEAEPTAVDETADDTEETAPPQPENAEEVSDTPETVETEEAVTEEPETTEANAEETAEAVEGEGATEEVAAESTEQDAEEGEAATEEVTAESSEEDAEEGEAETVDEGGKQAAQSLLAEILGDETNFDTVVEKASPNELALLMENIAERGDVGEFISKVGMIKRSFDKKTDEETAEKDLLSRFSTALARFNKKRVAYYAEREREKEDNSQKKYALLERLKQIVQEEQVTKIQEVREIQNEWRNVGWVLQKDIQPLNETYRQYLDIFYNLRSKYQELLDLDREYNLKQKQAVIQNIEALVPEEDTNSREIWNDRSVKVRALQEEWKAIGHVPRENVEEINTSYRAVLDRFYGLRSGYYEIQDAQKGENAIKKKELLEQLKVYSDFASDKAKDWNTATKAVLEIQSKWKEIGPGPLAENKTLWKEYRALCDNFFNKKGSFFKSFDSKRAENLKLKIAICEKAESVMESEEWKETAQMLKDLQKEWKTIGPVHERHSNKVWKRFRKACDHFFDRRSASSNSDRSGYDQNLKVKEALIKELQGIANSENPADHMNDFNRIQSKWKETGHVPFKVKDKINNGFKEAIGLFFENSKLGRKEIQRLKLEANINSISDEDSRTRRIKGEMRKLQVRRNNLKDKVAQYEINIQYISKGKKGDPLRKQIQAQIDAEKVKIKELQAKLKDLKHLLDNPPEEKPEPEAEAPAVEAAEEAPAAEAAEEAPAAEAAASDDSEE